MVKKLSSHPSDSIFKSFVKRRRAADIAVARRGEVDNVTDDLEKECPTGSVNSYTGVYAEGNGR